MFIPRNIYLLLLFIYSTNYAQVEIDSLIKQLNSNISTEKKAQTYIDIAWEYMSLENDSALHYVSKGYDFSKKNDYSFGMIINLEMKGIYLESVKNDYVAASKIYLEAIEIAEKSDNSYLSSLYLSLGTLFNQISDYKKSNQYYDEAILNATKYKNKEVIKISLVNKGINYSNLQDYDRALEYYNKCLSIATSVPHQDDAVYFNIGNVYQKKDNFKKAHEFFIKSLKNPKAKDDLFYSINFTELLKNKLHTNNLAGIDTLIDILRNYEKNLQSNKTKLPILETLSEAYEKKGAYKKALDYKRKYIQVLDSFNIKTNEEIIYDVEQKYQNDKKQLIIEENKAQKKLYYVIFSLLGLGIISLALFFRNKQKKNKLLAKQNKIISKALKDNETLLKETHHRVKNSLQMISSLLYLQSENIENKAAAQSVKDGQIRVKSMALIHQKLYQTDDLTGVNVANYIKDLATDIFQSHHIENNEIALRIDVDNMILDVDTITPIGIILNELIVNSLKHAFPDKKKDARLEIIFKRNKDSLLLKVKDNGKGSKTKFDDTKSFGIKLIHSLARKLKATIDIQNSNGTEVTLHIKNYKLH